MRLNWKGFFAAVSLKEETAVSFRLQAELVIPDGMITILSENKNDY
jgi:hypothetical protein